MKRAVIGRFLLMLGVVAALFVPPLAIQANAQSGQEMTTAEEKENPNCNKYTRDCLPPPPGWR